MKTNVVQKANRKIETIQMQYICPVTDETKEIKVVLQEPSFEEVCEAYKYTFDENGKLDPITAGKLILDLCALEYSDEILQPRLLMSVCAQIQGLYTTPIMAEIKKKD